MNRREVLKSVGLIVGGTIIGAEAFLAGCSFSEDQVGLLSQKQLVLMNEIADTILPTTAKSPGAKEVNVAKTINTLANAFYSPIEKQVLLEGLKSYKDNSFESLSRKKREEYLTAQELEAKQNPVLTITDDKGESFETVAAIVMIKQLSIWAYLSSEAVATTAFNYLPVPGAYDGCVAVTDEVKPMYPSPRVGHTL